MNDLVLSLFPGIDLLGRGFEAENFCVVRGPDILWGGDIRSFHVPAGRFDIVTSETAMPSKASPFLILAAAIANYNDGGCQASAETVWPSSPGTTILPG
jgi:hypothetical protein